MRSLDRGLLILDTFMSRQQQSLSEIAEAVTLPKSTAHRLLSTLEMRGYVTLVGGLTGVYKIGMKSLLFTTAHTRIHRQLEYLRSITGETVNLGALVGNEIEYIDRVLSEHALRWGVNVGSRIPLYCSALGKCVLAFRPDLALAPNEWSPRTAKTITDVTELKPHLELIRNRGYADEDEEFIEGVVCIAAPVRDGRGQVVGAVSVSGPSVRFTKEKAQSFAPQVIDVAQRVSHSISEHTN